MASVLATLGLGFRLHGDIYAKGSAQ